METTKLYELKKIQTDFPRILISSSLDCYNFIKNFYQDDIEIYESFFILLLNKANHTIGYAKISQGGIAGTHVDIKIILKYALDSLASSVILAHNHPSGNLRESEQDINITNKIKYGLELLDINLFDHIILTKESFSSFADKSLLK